MRLLIILVLITSSSLASAADIEAGKAKAVACAACHGPAGVSSNPAWPNLAGQKDAYLATQIKAFRDGVRSDPLMEPMVKTLTDEDAVNLAAYFSSLTQE